MIKLMDLINEGNFHKSKGWMMYEGHSHVVTVFEDNSKLQFEVDFHANRGLDRDKWKRKAVTEWKKQAKAIHDNIQITEVGNRIQKSWKQSFEEALKSPELKQFIKEANKKNVFDDAGYPAKVQGKPAPCVDPVNFTPRV